MILNIIFLFGFTLQLEQNNRPVIGVFSQNHDRNFYDDPQKSYIAMQYVQFLEFSGAQIVPILFDYDQETLLKIFQKVNGIFIPGGGTNLVIHNHQTGEKEFSRLQKSINYIVQLAKDANDRGDYFPIWGTCLGIEALGISLLNDINILDNNMDDDNNQHSIEFANLDQSRVFKQMDENSKQWISNNNVLNYYHSFGFSKENFDNNQLAQQEILVTGYSVTPKGLKFVASMESKKYPFYGVQFHPEKAIFVFKPSCNVSHDSNTIKAMQTFSDFFISQAKNNFHTFQDYPELNLYEIANFEIIKLRDEQAYDQLYLFPYQNIAM